MPLRFPQLTRKPALKTQRQHIDPTLRDSMDNGMESTKAKFTRRRRQYSVTIEHLTNGDVDRMDDFVELEAVYGANSFLFLDPRNPKKPAYLTVRFSSLPQYTDEGSVEGEFRQTCSFTLREV